MSWPILQLTCCVSAQALLITASQALRLLQDTMEKEEVLHKLMASTNDAQLESKARAVAAARDLPEDRACAYLKVHCAWLPLNMLLHGRTREQSRLRWRHRSPASFVRRWLDPARHAACRRCLLLISRAVHI